MMESLDQGLAAINYWCLKWHMRLNPENTKSMVVSRSRTIDSGYDDHTLGGAKLEEVKSLRILMVTLDSMLKFETHLREIVSKAASSQGIVQESYLFDCLRVLKSCFTTYVLSSLKYCTPE